ncbi:XopAW family type III secretion system calcium-binding effector [Pseudomonas syringae group sp. J309-1]|uniref:XopAW family type III secretion system calcium-binding effector n=1 Tax=Pseudomonas syringae group sp. J309-1 TaxID=3079588 RepID=UPI002906BD05|nr:XopAW family type III secretion system calcium-binding effector [Pseudomonas syringae group sp. J309-1]MDU8358710.1 XopAW family type III secretion system calcium-binding effector [Pseudomonas syringae group sp. J309-1]
MISGVSNNSYSSYTSSSASTAASKKFQEQLLAKLDTDGDGSVSKDELSAANSSSDSKDGITVTLSEAFSSLDANEYDSLDADELAALTPPLPPSGQPATDVAEDLLSALDTDGDGAINSDELTAGLSSAGSTADSAQVFDALDTNKDGTVSLDELTASLQPQQPPAPPASSLEASEQLFSSLDADGDGSISADELTSALTATSNGSTNAENKASEALGRMVAALTERYDTSGIKPVGKYLDTAA